MNEQEYLKLLESVRIGKRLPSAIYLHKSWTHELPDGVSNLLDALANALGIKQTDWNIAKLHTDDYKISFLNYPSFDSEAYPALSSSKVVDLRRRSTRDLSFSEDPNPPILHRKELMVSSSYPLREEFSAITQEGVNAGLYVDTRRIGFKRDWERLIQTYGYELVDGRLFRSSSFQQAHDQRDYEQVRIFRERTALSRTQLSVPVRLLSELGFLDGRYTFCDYGCGRGDDLTLLKDIGVDAIGWDPNFFPEGDRLPSDIVNLGYVINVIEDRSERDEALIRSFALAQRLMVVSAMIASDAHIARFRSYKDGVITSRNTFQKYYAQQELQTYIETTLSRRALPVSTGIFFIFVDEELESDFIFRTAKPPSSKPKNSISVPRRPSKIDTLVESNRAAIEAYWLKALEFGRWPTRSEYAEAEHLEEQFGSARRSQSVILKLFDRDQLESAAEKRREELTLSQAMSFFRGRQPFNRLSEHIQSDIRVLFGSYQNLQSNARELLTRLTNTPVLESACRDYFERTLHGHLEPGRAYTVSTQNITDLPVVLRAYIGCAYQTLGVASTYQLVKVHMHTGKVSFMRYENYSDAPIPLLVERVKVNLWQQRTTYFDYVDEFSPKPLYWKSKFLARDDAGYEKQRRFDAKLDELGLAPENPHFGFAMEQLAEILQHKGLEIRGTRFFKVSSKH